MRFFLTVFLLGFFTSVFSQGAVYSIKGGPVLGVQKWDNQLGQRNPLLSYHIIAGIEELTEDSRFTVFAQAGLHQRGTSTRTRFFRQGGTYFDQSLAIKFTNIALSIGAKKRIGDWGAVTPYYMLGVRGEYTVKTNLDQFEKYNECYPIYPINDDNFIKKFNYGAIFGAGVEFGFTELLGGLIEFSVNPDFSHQYVQPAINNVLNTCGVGTGQPTSVPKREISNLTFELTLGLRFLHKVEYVE